MAIEPENPPGVPEWVVTFGDMMSLLLTFFIMLVSLSEIKKDEMYQALVESMRRQFGYENSTASLSPGQHTPRTAQLARLASLGRSMRADLMEGGDKPQAPVGENPRVRTIRPGERVRVGTVIYFGEGETALGDASRRVLEQLLGQIGGKPQKIEVRGHTTRRPVTPDGALRDNWDLAYERARRTMEYLVELGVDPARVRMGVAAAGEPLNDALDPDEFAKNARVEVFLLDELTPQTTAPDAQQP